MTAVELKNVSKDYGRFKAVRQVDLKVEKNDIYGLIGRNGAGKTTIFKLILGLSPLTEGEILINGKSGGQLAKEKSKIGFFIGQNFFDHLSARENIEYYRRLKGLTDRSETDRVLKIVGLYGVKKPFKSFSMGMKQRLGIANAILGKPEILILDEPVNGLDPQGIKEVRLLIKKLNEEEKMTIIISSHILSELDAVADKFGIINEGRLVKELKKEDLLSYGDQVYIRVEDKEGLRSILREDLGLEKVLEEGDYLIVDNELVADRKALTKKIVDRNLGLIEIYKNKESLEDYYFEVTGE